MDTPRKILSLLSLAALALVHRADAADPPPRPAGRIQLRSCAMDYEFLTQVGAINQGSMTTFLQECLVQPGDRVKAGQVLGRLQNRDILAQMLKLKATAENLLDIQISENQHEQAKVRLRQQEALMKRNFSPVTDYNIIVLSEKQAALDVERARYVRALAQFDYQQAEVEYRNRDFRSPHDGVVVEVYKHAGERITNTDPVFLVVDDSKLLVTGQLDVADAWRVKKGQRVRVFAEVEGAEIPIEKEEFRGEVVFVDNRIDPANRTCKVVARVENRDLLLRAGLEARMEIDLAAGLALGKKPEDVLAGDQHRQAGEVKAARR